jgi:hypothetical protein
MWHTGSYSLNLNMQLVFDVVKGLTVGVVKATGWGLPPRVQILGVTPFL